MRRHGELDCDVLVIEDDALAAKLLEVIIERHAGHRVQVIASAEQAIRALRRTAADRPEGLPSAIVTDVHLGEGDSFGVIGWVRTSAATESVRVLVVTADATEATRRAAIDAGADLIATKSDFLASPGVWMGKIMPEAAADAA